MRPRGESGSAATARRSDTPADRNRNAHIRNRLPRTLLEARSDTSGLSVISDPSHEGAWSAPILRIELLLSRAASHRWRQVADPSDRGPRVPRHRDDAGSRARPTPRSRSATKPRRRSTRSAKAGGVHADEGVGHEFAFDAGAVSEVPQVPGRFGGPTRAGDGVDDEVRSTSRRVPGRRMTTPPARIALEVSWRRADGARSDRGTRSLERSWRARSAPRSGRAGCRPASRRRSRRRRSPPAPPPAAQSQSTAVGVRPDVRIARVTSETSSNGHETMTVRLCRRNGWRRSAKPRRRGRACRTRRSRAGRGRNR